MTLTTTKPALILTPSQAEAVYAAMCALNNVGGSLDARMEDRDGRVIAVKTEGDFNDNRVTVTYGLRTVECYATQADFATAYGLSTGA